MIATNGFNSGDFCVINLKSLDDPHSDWFESEICGEYDYCYSQIRALSLDMHFKIQFVEA